MPVLDLAPSALVAATLAMALGSAVQAALGIGLALLVVPLLALVDPGFIPGPMMLAGIVVTLATAARERSAIEMRPLLLALFGLLAGTALGAVALSLVAGPALPRLFGALVLLAVAVSLSGLRVAPTGRALLAVGAAAGLMGTMVGIHGPPIMLVFQHARPPVVRAMLGVFFAVGYAVAVLALAAAGLFGTRELLLALVLLPGTIAGTLAAPLIAGLVDAKRLRVAILAVAATSGIALLLR